MATLWVAAATVVLVLHLLFNLWFVFGALVTRDRPLLERLHILSLLYGAVMENVSWSCPLTVAEKWCLAMAGETPYHGEFLVHYLQTLVSPNFPVRLLGLGAIGICLINLAVYARRHMVLQRHAFPH